MIHRDFVDPAFSFRCNYLDWCERKCEALVQAVSEQALRDKIKTEGCEVTDVKPYTFAEWKAKAEKKTKAAWDAYNAGGEVKLDRSVWAEIKIPLFDLFKGKCAYCESKVRHVADGDVEHFRPKGAVTEDPKHPGYFWLAYDCANLLPSCPKCNRALAKMNHFPIEGQRAYPGGDMTKEKPALLNPYSDDPTEHIEFATGRNHIFTGKVVGKTKRGRASIQYYHLDRPELDEMRRTEQEQVEKDLLYCIARELDDLKTLMQTLKDGTRQYSAAALAQAKEWWARRHELLQ
jgi:uncharacterized protein (TIGR02646 family)